LKFDLLVHFLVHRDLTSLLPIYVFCDRIPVLCSGKHVESVGVSLQISEETWAMEWGHHSESALLTAVTPLDLRADTI
jgi:uncharacterized membrane protein